MGLDLKILQLGKFYPIRGGVEKVMYDLMLGLSEKQIYCDMLCATTEDHPGGIIELNAYARVMAIRTQFKLAATMIAPNLVLRLRRIANNYDIIHIHHPDPMACLALYLSGYKGKVVLHWHSDILKQKTLLKLYGPLQSWLVKRADIIVGTSPVYVRESSFLNKVQHKVDYIPIGVEPISPNQREVERLREKYKGKKLIFALGRLVEYKGYEYLIEAISGLDDDYQLLIGGKGPLEEELKELIRRLDLQDRVELLGYIADEHVPNYYGACHVFCLTSTMKTEAFAIVQIEAMSCGKPIISTKVPGSGVSWVNADGESGLCVGIRDAKAVANAIELVMNDAERYNQLSDGSLSRYQSLFTRDKMVYRSLEIYKRIRN